MVARRRGSTWAIAFSLAAAAAVCGVTAEAASAATGSAVAATATDTATDTGTATGTATGTGTATSSASATSTATTSATPGVPTLTLTAAPSETGWSRTKPVFAYTLSDPAGRPVHVECYIGVAVVDCTDPAELTSFPDWRSGSNTVGLHPWVTDVNTGERVDGATQFVTFHYDFKAPTVDYWSTLPNTYWAVTATDDNALAHMQVRLLRRDYKGTWAPIYSPSSWTVGPATAGGKTRTLNTPFLPASGVTSCPQALATDAAGNTSGWTNSHVSWPVCASNPVDDRALARSGSWSSVSSASSLNGTLSRSYSYGSTLTLPQIFGYYAVLYWYGCPSCGKVAVYSDHTYLGTVDTVSSSTHARLHKTVFTAVPAARGPFIIRVVTKNKPVFIDGVDIRSVRTL